jgi:hypothetical protein
MPVDTAVSTATTAGSSTGPAVRKGKKPLRRKEVSDSDSSGEDVNFPSSEEETEAPQRKKQKLNKRALTDYDIERNANIEKNRALLASLGLGGSFESQMGLQGKQGNAVAPASEHVTHQQDVVPAREHVPAPDDIVPSPDDIVPAPDEIVPANDDPVRVLDNAAPTLANTIPADDPVRVLDDAAPTLDDAIPANDNVVPTAASGDVVPVNEDAPTHDDNVPATEDVAIAHDNNFRASIAVNDAPEWVRDAWAFFGEQALGDDWSLLVEEWVKFERSVGFGDGEFGRGVSVWPRRGCSN